MAGVLSVYARTLRTYADRAGTLLPLAVVVFVPLGLIHSIPIHADVSELGLIESVELLVVAAVVLVLALTGLLGQVFYAGAVTIALTHRDGSGPRTLAEVARMIDYRTLIAVDIAYGVAVALGLVTLVVPGVLVFIYAGLAAPVSELEHCGFRESFSRSASLVRGNFWLVFWVLVPIELASDAVTRLAGSVSDGVFSAWLLSEWATDALSNILLTPVYAVAAVLLTLDLTQRSEAGGRRPGPAAVAG